MDHLKSAPIGVLDSGIGGISIVKSLMEQLPYENILYFGDTAHMPFGRRSHTEVRQYTEAIIEFFISQDCKCIIIACNTATAVMEETIQHYQAQIKIFNVIDPVVQYITHYYNHKKVGLLCTDLTYKLGIFERKIALHGEDIELISFKATQLAQAIEMEFENTEKLKKLIREYFFNYQFRNAEAIILGCTHYLWLKNHFMKLNPFIDWVEPSTIVVKESERYLVERKDINEQTAQSVVHFYQSGEDRMFFERANRFTSDSFQKVFYAGKDVLAKKLKCSIS